MTTTESSPQQESVPRNLEPQQLLAQAREMDFWALVPEGLRNPPPQELIAGALTYRNVTYATRLGFRPLQLDVHVPAKQTAPHPTVIYAHPGGYFGGLKEMGPWQFLPSVGYAVISVSYRLREESVYPAALHDVKAAIRWTRAEGPRYGLRTDDIVGWGSSAGAYLMTQAALTSDQPRFEGDVGRYLDVPSQLVGVIDFYGPSDWTTWAEDAHPDGPTERPGTPLSTESAFLGYVPAEQPADAADASPLTHVRADAPPFLICHGDADTRLGQAQSLRLYKALTEVGADVTFVNVAGANHGGPEFEDPEMQERVLAFLERVLDR